MPIILSMKNRLFLAAAASGLALVAVVGVASTHRPQDRLAVVAGSVSNPAPLPADTPPPATPAPAPAPADEPTTTTTSPAAPFASTPPSSATSSTVSAVVTTTTATAGTEVPAPTSTTTSTPTTEPTGPTTSITEPTPNRTWTNVATVEATNDAQVSDTFVNDGSLIRFDYQISGTGTAELYFIASQTSPESFLQDGNNGEKVFELSAASAATPRTGTIDRFLPNSLVHYYLYLKVSDGTASVTASELRQS